MELDLVVISAAILEIMAAGLGLFAILNVIGDCIGLFTAVFIVGPAAILELLSAFGFSILI
jgi:hypothetical protein